MNAPASQPLQSVSARAGHRSLGALLDRGRRRWRVQARRGLRREGVLAKVHGEAALTWRYIFMTAMSAGIAILGLLLSSPAVVIGAMLLSPLMGPMLGAGFALATGDFAALRVSARSLLLGIGCAVAFCALIVALSPLQTITGEIAARTRPNLFDLLVALFSALAGSYAMIRGREGTIVGVAIATAVMPPLAVVGFGLATWNETVFSGALLLFVTNALTITLSAAVMARLYGFSSSLSPRQSLWQAVGIAAALALLAVPLGLALSRIALEANGQRIARNVVAEQFPDDAKVNALEIDWNTRPIAVVATVLTPSLRPGVGGQVERLLGEQLGQPVAATVQQLQVGRAPGAAEQAALAVSGTGQAAPREQAVATMADRLALVAGVAREDVLVDVDNRRAEVAARPLPGLQLAGWRELERRAAATAPPGWRVALRPPLLPLPTVTLEEGELDADGAAALDVITWAARRTSLPVALTGGGEAQAAVAERLRSGGAMVVEQGGGGGEVTAEWSLEGAAGS